MAIHPNSTSLTNEAIEEYLFVAGQCINTKKEDGGIYGYPATLLLFCVVNAIGKSLIGGNEPFRVLNQPIFNCGLNNSQIKQMENWYRNLLAHNGMIAPGACLSPEDNGDPFGFDVDEPVLIRVKPFYQLVRLAWNQLDKTVINCNYPRQQSLEITKPMDFSNASLSVPIAASGSYYHSKPARPKRKPGGSD